MANEQLINELVSEAAYAQIAKLEKALEATNEVLVQNILNAQKFGASMASVKTFSDLEQLMKKIAILEERLKKLTAERMMAEDKLANFRTKAAADFERKIQKEQQLQEKKAKQLENASKKEILAEEKKQAAYKKTAEQIANNSRPYTILSNELEKQRKRAQDLAIIYGENSKQFKEAAKSVSELDARLKAIDAVLGKNQRNVGNYKSGFNGLTNSVNQLTREFPAFTYSVQTGFMALSNNLPIFFDQIKQTQAEIKAMRAEGQKVPGLFKQLAASVFSWGTALSVGITLLTVYGKEIGDFISATFQGTKALDEFTERQRLLGEAMKDSGVKEAIMNVSELRVNIKLAKEGFLDKEKVLNQYNETIGKTTGEVTNLNDAEAALNKNAEAYIKVTLLKAAAQLALKEAAESAFEAEKVRAQGEKDLAITGAPGDKKIENLSFAQRLKAAFTQDDSVTKTLIKERTKELATAAENQQNTLKGIFEKLQTEAAKLAKASGFADFFGGEFDSKNKKGKGKIDTSEFDAQRERVERTKDASKRIIDNEKESYELRLSTLDVYINQSEELVRINYDRELKKAKGNKDKIVFLEEQRQTQLQDVRAEGREMLQKLMEDQLSDEMKARLRANQEVLNAINNEESLKLQLLNQAYNNGTISEKQHEELRLQLQKEYFLKYINEEIRQTEELLNISSLSVDQRAEYEKKLAKLKLEASEYVTKGLIADNNKVAKTEEENAKRRAEVDKQLADKKKQFQTEISNLAVSIVEGTFENDKNRIQNEIDLGEKRKQIEIDNVNNSLLTEQEKADKIAVIEATALANKEALEKRQREIDQRKARFQKAMSIANIGMSTAEAIMKTYAEFGWPIGIPLAIAQGAIGAVQIAAVLATPIPQYKDGKKKSDNYSGLAWVGDGYEHELRIDPDGSTSLTPNKPTLTHVSAGTQIISGPELKRMIAKPQLSSTFIGPGNIDIDRLIMEQRNSTSRIEKALSRQKQAKPPIVQVYNMSDYISRNFS